MPDFLNDGVTWPEAFITFWLLIFAAFCVVVLMVLLLKMMDLD